MNATSVTVTYNSSSVDYSGVTLAVGSINALLDVRPGPGLASVEVKGFSATLGSFGTL